MNPLTRELFSFDSLVREKLLRIMAEDGALLDLIDILQSGCIDTKACVSISENDPPKSTAVSSGGSKGGEGGAPP